MPKMTVVVFYAAFTTIAFYCAIVSNEKALICRDDTTIVLLLEKRPFRPTQMHFCHFIYTSVKVLPKRVQ